MRRYIWLAVAVVCGVMVTKGMVAAPPANTAPLPVAAALQVGAVPTDSRHEVSRPGLYGLGLPPEGSSYAIVGNNLVRVDSTSNEVLGIVRAGVRPINEGLFD